LARKINKNDLISRAKKAGQDALIMHYYYQGKMQTVPRCIVRGYEDFSIWYSHQTIDLLMKSGIIPPPPEEV
jgi:hypothetical protein